MLSLAALGLLYLLHLGRSFLVPLVFAFFVWYLVNTLAGFLGRIPLGRRRFPAPLAFTGALAAIAALVFLFVRVVASNVSAVAASAPAYQRNLERLVARISAALPVEQPPTLQALAAMVDFGKAAKVLALELTEFTGQGLIVLLYLAFIFLEQRSFATKLAALTKDPGRRQEARAMIARIDSDIRIYIGIKTSSSLATALLAYLIFRAVGLDFASFWALLVFILNFVPTIGSIAATALPALLALLQFESPVPFLAVAIGLTAVQQAFGNFIEPRFLGNRLNLSPLVILLSLALWGKVWGVAGMFLCVPMTSVAVIILSSFPQTRPLAVLLSRRGRIDRGDRPGPDDRQTAPQTTSTT